jgi:biopolymer transport protein ExbD
MKFQQQLKWQYGLHPIHIVPMVNVVLLLLLFFILTSPLCFQPGFKVELPKTVTSDIVREGNLTVTITGENLIYFNDSVVTIKELKTLLAKHSGKKPSVLIKANRSSSLGRIVDVWDLCRSLGIERINLATNQRL